MGRPLAFLLGHASETLSLVPKWISPLKQVLVLHHKQWIRAEGLSPYWERHLFSHIPGHAKTTLKKTRLSKNSTIQKRKESFNDSALARLKSGLKFTELTASHSWTWGFHFLSVYYVPNTRLSAGDKGGEGTGTEPAKTQTGETSCFLPLLCSFVSLFSLPPPLKLTPTSHFCCPQFSNGVAQISYYNSSINIFHYNGIHKYEGAVTKPILATPGAEISGREARK